MKTFAKFGLALTLLSFLAISGCGTADNEVIEAPETEVDDASMEGMTEEEYNKAMEEDMG